jgi:hypothetical protein
MDSQLKSRTFEIIRVFIFGGAMLFLSSQIQFVWILFLILLILGVLTRQFTYLSKVPVDRFNFNGYQFFNVGFFILLIIIFGYRYVTSFSEKTLVEKIYWPIFLGTYLFNLKMVKRS